MVETILFGHRAEWIALIAERLDPVRYVASFAPLEHVRIDAFAAVVPLSIADYTVLAQRPDLLGRSFLHPPLATARLCNDKLALAEHLIARGFGAHIPAIRTTGDGSYPIVRRPRCEEYGQGARLLLGADDEVALSEPADSEFDQAYVPGADEYALHLIRHDGRIRFAWALHHRMAGPGLIRGIDHSPVNSQPIDPAAAIAVFAPMLASLDYEGTCCIDYKIHDGVVQLLEINPRFGASLAFGINAYLEAYMRCLRR